MFPILFQKGPITLYTYGAMMALAFVLVLFLSHRNAKSYGFSKEFVSDFCFYVLLGGVVGARVFFVIENMSLFSQNPVDIFKIYEGGLVFYGGLIGGVATAFLMVRIKQQSWRRVADFFLPYLALAHGVGRLGCFFNGCCYGVIQIGSVVWPVQLAEALYNVSVGVLLLSLRSRFSKRGLILPVYLALYGLGRFVLEFVRADDVSQWGGLRVSQWLSLGLCALSLLIYLKCFKGEQR